MGIRVEVKRSGHFLKACTDVYKRQAQWITVLKVTRPSPVVGSVRDTATSVDNQLRPATRKIETLSNDTKIANPYDTHHFCNLRKKTVAVYFANTCGEFLQIGGGLV